MPGFWAKRFRSPLHRYTKGSSAVGGEEDCEFAYDIEDFSLSRDGCSKRVMIVVDSINYEAVEWALSHTLQTQDTLILLHAHTKDGENNEKAYKSAYHLLQTTKNMCQLRRPEVQVEIAIQQGKEKGATIVEAAKQLRAAQLVLGQRKQLLLKFLHIWRRKTWSRVVDYCIQNADCATVAVTRKSSRYGGYLITTKRHKNFWLLA